MLHGMLSCHLGIPSYGTLIQGSVSLPQQIHICLHLRKDSIQGQCVSTKLMCAGLAEQAAIVKRGVTNERVLASLKDTCLKTCHARQAQFKCSNTAPTEIGQATSDADEGSVIQRLEATGEKHISLSDSALRGAATVEHLVLPRIDAFQTYFGGSIADSDGSSLGAELQGTFDNVCGHPEIAAIYVRRNSDYFKKAMRKQRVKLSEVKSLLQSDAVGAEALLTHLNYPGSCMLGVRSLGKLVNRGRPDYTQLFYRSLKISEQVAEVYKHLPNTTVAVSVLSQPLHWARWESSGYLSRPQTFACIARFESGNLSIEPTLLREVIAMSSGKLNLCGSHIVM